MFVYGPVFSRRLGRSLGVNLTPDRICSFDCIYCEEGCPTKNLTLERAIYADTDTVIQEINKHTDPHLDFITFSGEGEPTLHQDLGKILAEIKKLTVPSAVLTNSSLLVHQDVQEDLAHADLLVPSLDSVSETIFQQVNRPHSDVELSDILSGLEQTAHKLPCEIWLEILVVKGFNDNEAEFKQLAYFVNTLPINKVQLNTLNRGTTVPGIKPVSYQKLERLASMFKHPVELYD